MLSILTGNVGINGGNSGAWESTYTITIERLPVGSNPVKTKIPVFFMDRRHCPRSGIDRAER